MKILFWLLVAIDSLVLGGIFLLGLGFAGPSQVYTMGHVNRFVIPVGLLVASVVLFVGSKSPMMRGVVFVLALSPVMVLFVSYAGAGPPKDRALVEAIQADDLEAVRSALRTADVNKAGTDGVTPLTKAMDKFLETENAAVMREILEAGARVNGGPDSAVLPLERAIEMTRHHGTEPMMLLLKAGAKPNAIDPSAEPAFFAAAEKGIDDSVMQTLVEHGADLRMANEQGKTVLDRAIFRGNRPVEQYLREQGLASGQR